MYHLKLEQRFVTIIEKIPRLSAVDPHDTEEKLSRQTKSHGSLSLVDDGIDTGLDVRLHDIVLGELALEIGSEPYSSQRPGLGQESLRVEHGEPVGRSMEIGRWWRGRSRWRKLELLLL
jgi:hypothetical protein